MSTIVEVNDTKPHIEWDFGRRPELSENEGFFSEDSTPVKRRPKQTVIKGRDYRPKEQRRRSSLFLELQGANARVDCLMDRVKELEEMIEKMTVGFFKDLNHYKTMLSRQDLEEEELFEVNYFDSTKVLDERSKTVVDHYLSTYKVIYKSQLQTLRHKFNHLEAESDKLQKAVNVLLNKTDAQQLMKLAVKIENNPYVIWKYIQDIIGNETIFQVFEKQMHSYGINYKQIDILLSQSQSSSRIFQQVKDKMDEQLAILGKRAAFEIKELKEKLENLKPTEQKDQNLNRQEFGDLDYIKDIIKKELASREEQFKKRHQLEMKIWIEDWQTTDVKNLIHDAVARSAIQKWSLLTKFSRLSDTVTKTLFELELNYKQRQQTEESVKVYSETSLKIKQHLFELRKALIGKAKKKMAHPNVDIEQQLHVLQQQLGRSQFNLEETEEANKGLEGQLRVVMLLNNSYKIRIAQLELQLQQSEIYTAKLKSEKQRLELELHNYDKAFGYLVAKLGFKQHELTENFLEKKYSKQLKLLQQRIKSIKTEDVICMEEFSEFYTKTDYVFKNLSNLEGGTEMIDQGTLTNYFNITYSLTQLEQKKKSEYEKVENLLYKPKATDKEVQVDLMGRSSVHTIRSVMAQDQAPQFSVASMKFENNNSVIQPAVALTIEDQTQFRIELVEAILKENIDQPNFFSNQQIQMQQQSSSSDSQIQNYMTNQKSIKVERRAQLQQFQQSQLEQISNTSDEQIKVHNNSDNIPSKYIYKGSETHRSPTQPPEIQFEHLKTEQIVGTVRNMVLQDLKCYGKLHKPQHLKTHHIDPWIPSEISGKKSERERLLKMIEQEQNTRIGTSRNHSVRRQSQRVQNTPISIRLRPIYSIEREFESPNPYTPQYLEQIEMLKTHFPPENILKQLDICLQQAFLGEMRVFRLWEGKQHLMQQGKITMHDQKFFLRDKVEYKILTLQYFMFIHQKLVKGNSTKVLLILIIAVASWLATLMISGTHLLSQKKENNELLPYTFASPIKLPPEKNKYDISLDHQSKPLVTGNKVKSGQTNNGNKSSISSKIVVIKSKPSSPSKSKGSENSQKKDDSEEKGSSQKSNYKKSGKL